MTQLNPRLLAEPEILKLAQHGVSFLCPVCQTPLQPVPANWQPGQELNSLACPNSHNHFLAYGDVAHNHDSYREWIESRSNTQYE
ncbi:MAG: hypothetical protein P8163_19300 [Candidatus Thiodiazotropha sp.]